MSDEFDEEVSLDDTFDDFGGDGGTLGGSWRDTPAFKLGLVAVAVIVIFLVVKFIANSGDKIISASHVGGTPNVSIAPGTEEASPAYIQAIEEQNEADREAAELSGGSALPVPIEPPVGVISVPQDDNDAEDPLQRWRRLQEERLQREIQQRETIGAVSVNDVAEQNDAIASLADLMRQQMDSILGTRSEVKISTMNVTDADFLKNLFEDEEEAETREGEDDFEEEIIQETLLPAGQIVYAQLLTEANTDSPGPVLAQILAGPLAGSRVIGTFEVQPGDLLTLNFDTIVVDEESLSIEAIALDPETTLPGMATEVDHRYLKRIVLPAAAAFIDGLAGAVAESDTTTITINGSNSSTSTNNTDLNSDQEIATGVEEVGAELREILDEIADETQVLIRIEAGTPIGILFTEPVQTEDTEI